MFAKFNTPRHSNVFFEAYFEYKKREHDIEYYSQIKLQSLCEVEKMLKGIIPGNRKKWIEYSGGKWLFHDKFFIIFDCPELLKLRNKIVQCIPTEIRPTEKEMAEKLDNSDICMRMRKRPSKKLRKLVEMFVVPSFKTEIDNESISNKQMNDQKQLKMVDRMPLLNIERQPQKKIYTSSSKQDKQKQLQPIQMDEINNKLLVSLMEKWMSDITFVTKAARERKISLKKLQTLGLTECVDLVKMRAQSLDK